MTRFNDICKKPALIGNYLSFFFLLWKFKFWFEKLIILFLANLTCFIFRNKNFTFFLLIPLVLYISFFKPLLKLLLYLFYFLVFIFHFIIHKNSNKKLTLFIYIHKNSHKYTSVYLQKIIKNEEETKSLWLISFLYFSCKLSNRRLTKLTRTQTQLSIKRQLTSTDHGRFFFFEFI